MPFFGVILVCIFPHSDWIWRNTPGMPENADQNNSEYLHFSRSYRIYAGQTAPPSSDIIDRAWYKSFMRKSMKSVQRWWTLLGIGQWMLQPQVHFNKNLPLSTGYIFIHYSFLWIWSHLMKKSLIINIIFCAVSRAPYLIEALDLANDLPVFGLYKVL